MRRVFLALALIAVFLTSANPAFALSRAQFFPPEPPPTPWPRPPEGRPRPVDGQLLLKSYQVQATIEDQVATTRIEQLFFNPGSVVAEGTYLFALPEGASVSDFALWADGQRIEGKLLNKDEARSIYENIVRQQRDPALLEFVGRDLIQARIFPVPPNGQRRIELTYRQVLVMDNGLARYRFPLRVPNLADLPIEQVAINVVIKSRQPLKAIYSPTHAIDVERVGEREARIGYEVTDVRPEVDYELFYSVAAEEIGLNLLSYKPGGDDGFFLLLVAPQVEVEEEEAVAKDVVVVLDISGSMKGIKIDQAKSALAYVLDQLGPNDRFNVIAFSTGIRQYASGLRPAEERARAKEFVDLLKAGGSTDINRALLEALALLDGSSDSGRPALLIFLTDGLPTQGITDIDQIIANVSRQATKRVRLFAFGVGDDVNTTLLDTISQKHRGTSAYVRPNQPLDEIVSGFYAKVSTPVLADIRLDFGDVVVEDTYPYPLPDLFAGGQLVLAGRYRRGGTVDIRLTGEVNGKEQAFTYRDQRFATSGGEAFIARLWATRKIGHLLTQIRLKGSDRELVQEVVDLSVRYGIITPYTSYLAKEPDLALTGEGRNDLVEREVHAATGQEAPAYGAAAVEKSVVQEALRQADSAYGSAPMPAPAEGSGGSGRGSAGGEPKVESGIIVRQVLDKAFVWKDGTWIDTAYDSAKMKTVKIEFASRAYFDLLSKNPALRRYFALGQQVIIVLNGTAYEVNGV
ncbi:MAG: VWA domain-containing protein [Anaerolineae bacterium]|nr:VWA domain-containing protein [Anaerolineae bacterium]